MDQNLITEVRGLLPQPTLSNNKQLHRNKRQSACQHLCLPSKAAMLIIIWAAVVGAMYYFIRSVVVVFIYSTNPFVMSSMSAYVSIYYAIFAFAMILYPLNGFMADVCCGRLRVVITSLCFLLVCGLLTCLIEIVVFLLKLESISYYEFLMDFSYHKLNVVYQFVFVLISVSALLFLIGQAGFRANFIQLGLDQLFEAPSNYLALFIHYATWAFQLGSVPLRIISSFLPCTYLWNVIPLKALLSLIPLITSILLVLLLIISWRKRQWFYSHPGQENPYKTVFEVLNFARKHRCPLQRSAFTYGDDNIPSRIDFAKERFGGSFSVEQVENVKTFLRILTVLFAVGPVLSLEVPSSYFVFPLFGLHFLHYHKFIGKDFCDTNEHTWETVFVDTGSLMTLLSLVCFFPTYIWITFSLLHKKSKNFFIRILIGIVLSLLGIISLLIIDVIGHSLNIADGHNGTQCMFEVYRTNVTISYPALNMHWSVLIPANLLMEIGPLIVIATTFEFISAQSPQSMKGFLIGVFFAIRGFFQFLNSTIILPFSLKHPWASGEMLENHPGISCGFVYLSLTCVVGLIGLSLFLIAAKTYKYRERNEGLFSQQHIEEVFDRDIAQAAADTDSDEYSD